MLSISLLGGPPLPQPRSFAGGPQAQAGFHHLHHHHRCHHNQHKKKRDKFEFFPKRERPLFSLNLIACVFIISQTYRELLSNINGRLAFTANYGGGSFTVIGLGPAGYILAIMLSSWSVVRWLLSLPSSRCHCRSCDHHHLHSIFFLRRTWWRCPP